MADPVLPDRPMPAAPLLAALLVPFAAGQDPAPDGAPAVEFYPWRADIAEFADEIDALEERDRALYADGGPAEGAVLLAGSSSVRLWAESGEVTAGMAPVPVVARGYGGARYSDFAWYADRLFAPHLTPGEDGANVSAVALFVGNDLGTDREQTPGGAAAFVAHTLATLRAQDADVPVLLIAVTPTPARFGKWDDIRAFNTELERFADANDGVFYLDAAPAYLTDDGTPNADLFRDDDLHQNAAGYAVWAGLIKAKLAEMGVTS